MNIRVDTHFVTGRKYLVNKDYATGGTDPSPWMVLADGCSSSKDTDIGARLIAMAAKEYIVRTLDGGSAPNPYDLAQFTALKAEAAARVLGLPLTALDATLVAAFVLDNIVNVTFVGDGAVIATSHDGVMRVTQVEYSHNAPYYPSYRVDHARDAAYRRTSEAGGAVKAITGPEGVQCESVLKPTVLRFPVAELASLLITSDGISSFVSLNTQQELPAEKVASSLVAIRSGEGDFIKRRLKRALGTWAKDAVYNTDDFSVGAMTFDKGG